MLRGKLMIQIIYFRVFPWLSGKPRYHVAGCIPPISFNIHRNPLLSIEILHYQFISINFLYLVSLHITTPSVPYPERQRHFRQRLLFPLEGSLEPHVVRCPPCAGRASAGKTLHLDAVRPKRWPRHVGRPTGSHGYVCIHCNVRVMAPSGKHTKNYGKSPF